MNQALWKRTSLALLVSIFAHCLLLSLAHTAGRGSAGKRVADSPNVSSKPVYTAILVSAKPTQPLKKVSAIARAQAPVKPSTEPLPTETTQTTAPHRPEKHGLLAYEGLRYFMASELDERPALLTDVDLERDPVSQIEGAYLVLRLLIGETGTVDNVEVVTNESAQALEDPAVKAFTDARFSPGILDGVPVRSQVLIEIKLEPAFPDSPK